MKRIKQELLDKYFVVNTASEEKMHEVVGLLCDSKLSLYDFDRYGKETCIKYLPKYKDCHYADKQCYESRGNTILNYDDIFEDCEVPDAKFEDTVIFEGGSVLHNTPVNINSVRGVSAESIEKFMKELSSRIDVNFMREYSGIFTGGNKMKFWELRCNEISDNVDIDFTKGKIYKLTKEGLETDSCLFKDFLDGDGITPYDKWRKYIRCVTKAYKATIDFSLVGNVERMKEMNKIEIKIEELKNSIINNQLNLEELETANKHANLSSKISSTKLLMDEEIELLKGYETLDDMRIGNIIINNNTVIVVSSYGSKAISKLSDGDTFNFLAGFFLCLTKLGSAIDTDFYDYSIHAALEDIELGNL